MQLSLQAQHELTALIHELRPIELKHLGLVPALQTYAGRWSRQTGIAAQVDARGERSVPPDVEQALFRTAQEALANVARHSQAGSTKIKLIKTKHIAILEVADDGSGFDPASGSVHGMGLATMQERIEALGGVLSIYSRPGKGTRVLARCKLD